MAIQKQWDKLEAAILLDNYLKYINNEITRKEAIELTSAELRNMAKSQHIEIDDIFRNVNGITFQMHSMESAYRGYTLMKPASKLFIEIVRIYNNDFNEYEKILKEARRMIPNTQSNKDTFISWLSKEVSPAQLSELYMDYQTIDEFCNKHKIFSGSLWDITDLDKVKRIQRYIETNRLFKFQHKRSMLRINVAIRYYVIYATEFFKPVEADYEEKVNTIMDDTARAEANSSVEVLDTSTTTEVNSDVKYEEKYPNIYPVVYESLKNSADIVGFRGASVIAIYENTRRVASCEIIKEILDNVSWAYSKGPKYFFASESDVEEPTKSEYITSKKDIEARKIETVSVAEKEESIVQETPIFKYERKDFSVVPVNEPIVSQSRIRSTSAADAFYDWLSGEQGLAVPTCRSYVSAVNCAEAFARDNNFVNQKLYTTDLNEAQETVKELLNNPAFIEMDNKQHHRFKSGLNKLLQYVGGGSITTVANEILPSSGRIRNTSESDAFYDWLLQEQGLAEPTCRSYVSAVNCAEAFARDNNLVNQVLYTSNPNEAQATVKELLNNPDFIEMDNKQHHRFKSGLNKLLQYVGGNSVATTNVKPSFDAEPFNGILVERFSRGYRMGSPLELRKFKRYWEGIYGTSPEWSDDEISKRIALCGIVHEDKVYMPQKMLDDDTRMKLFSYINKSFQEGKNVIYYEALFKEFSDDFLEHCMYNAEMLKAYLTYMNDNSYYIGRNFISKEANVRVSTYDEVKQCLEQKAMPMGYDEIYETLSHIPQQKIRNIIAQNSEFISNGRNEYFHISIFNISEDELEDISVIIQTAIDEKQFIGGNELVGSIKKKYPYIIDQNALLSDKGLRDAIGYKLADQFSFKGNIISRKGQALSMMEVFSDFCKQRSSFSLDELKILKQELDTVIYFEAVYANSLRISKDQFVSKSNAAFLPAETDEAIDRFCFGDYIPLGKITHFGSFPDAGFQWNSFLLEHYVAMYSPSYKLVHSNYNEGVCVGAIVKKVSDIDTIDELIVDVLAKNGLPLQKEKSLQYLCDEGYLGRRSYAGIEQLLIKAKELRNQKGL